MVVFFTNLWKKIKTIGCRWPKTIRIEVRDGDCALLGVKCFEIKNWNEVIPLGEKFSQEVMAALSAEIEEVYWRYEEV